MPKIMAQNTIPNNIKSLPDKKRHIYDFLNANPIAVLSSITPDDNPHGAVVYFSIDMRFVAAILTKADTQKYDNLTHNNHVMLTIYEALTQTTVQLIGKAIEVTDSYEINEIAEINLRASMKTSDRGVPAILKLEAGAYVAFRIHPHQVRKAVYGHSGPGNYTELFETIDSFDLTEF
jgi:hypothetical protein